MSSQLVGSTIMKKIANVIVGKSMSPRSAERPDDSRIHPRRVRGTSDEVRTNYLIEYTTETCTVSSWLPGWIGTDEARRRRCVRPASPGTGPGDGSLVSVIV